MERDDEARGERRSAYTGRYMVTGSHRPGHRGRIRRWRTKRSRHSSQPVSQSASTRIKDHIHDTTTT
ncbi:Atu4866 domain-containing protein [Streptomyces endocoffeicus]|uniref:Atu4866 domain-containing protein n=1 Tax=Streptomyces endocoffeicus TaxID=2898945 RepID=UPI0027DCFF79|nr:Atu4866 domain-containing protein [Streptomyces endocoffeicus]